MRFSIQFTGFETGQPIHINIALVGSILPRDGERTPKHLRRRRRPDGST